MIQRVLDKIKTLCLVLKIHESGTVGRRISRHIARFDTVCMAPPGWIGLGKLLLAVVAPLAPSLSFSRIPFPDSDLKPSQIITLIDLSPKLEPETFGL
jgi:hypothetical protein